MLRGSRGDAAGTELGSSLVDRVVSEHGNRFGPARSHASRVVAWAGSTVDRPIGPGRGGAAVVLRVPECLVPVLMETIKPGRMNDGGTQEVPRGAA